MVKLTETMDTHDHTHPHFNFDNSFARMLEGFFVSCQAEPAITPNCPSCIIFLLSNLSDTTPPNIDNNNMGGAKPTPTSVTAKEEDVRSHPSWDLASICIFIPPIIEIIPRTKNLKFLFFNESKVFIKLLSQTT